MHDDLRRLGDDLSALYQDVGRMVPAAKDQADVPWGGILSRIEKINHDITDLDKHPSPHLRDTIIEDGADLYQFVGEAVPDDGGADWVHVLDRIVKFNEDFEHLQAHVLDLLPTDLLSKMEADSDAA